MNDTTDTVLKIYACDFCGETEKNAQFLVKAFNGTCICAMCVDVAVALLNQQRPRILPIKQS